MRTALLALLLSGCAAEAESRCQAEFQACRTAAGGPECWNDFHECTGYAADCRAGLIHSVECE